MSEKPVGWRREPARHALAAKGIRTSHKTPPTYSGSAIRNTTPFWSGDYKSFIDEHGHDWGQYPDLTHKEMIEFLKRVRALVEQAGFHPVSGDCSEYAIALRYALGYTPVEYVACYVDQEDYDHGVAVHVAVNYKGRMYDASGVTSEETMRQHVVDWDPDTGEPPLVVTGADEYDILYKMHDEVDQDNIIGGSEDPDAQAKMERIMKQVLENGAEHHQSM